MYCVYTCELYVYKRVCPSNTVPNNLSAALLSSLISLCSAITIPTCAALQTCCSSPRYFLLLKETRSGSPVQVLQTQFKYVVLNVLFSTLLSNIASLSFSYTYIFEGKSRDLVAILGFRSSTHGAHCQVINMNVNCFFFSHKYLDKMRGSHIAGTRLVIRFISFFSPYSDD